MNWFFSWFPNRNKEKKKVETPNMLEMDSSTKLYYQIQQAKQEWILSQHSFEWAVHPEGIDYAVYAMEAAERKYMFLLNEAKRSGVMAKPTL
jgi:hypothetical protein